MAVYVDDAAHLMPRRRGPGFMIMCHMVADSLEELHEFAHELGLKPQWFQGGTFTPHYDVNKTKRRLAVEKGAKEITQREAVAILRCWRERWGKRT